MSNGVEKFVIGDVECQKWKQNVWRGPPEVSSFGGVTPPEEDAMETILDTRNFVLRQKLRKLWSFESANKKNVIFSCYIQYPDPQLGGSFV